MRLNILHIGLTTGLLLAVSCGSGSASHHKFLLTEFGNRVEKELPNSQLTETFTQSLSQQNQNGDSRYTDSEENIQKIAATDYKSVGLPVTAKGTPEEILNRYAYIVSYNPKYKIPNWVMWHLTASHTDGPYKRGSIKFQQDPEATNCPTTFDYQRSGYDRGHMCPSADNRWSQRAQEECFLLSNICPQNHNLNSGDWSEMEKQCRIWANQYGDIYIICGPIFLKNQVHKHIGHGVQVPEAFFKVVYCPSIQKAIGFIYRNQPGDRPKGDYVNSVDEIERITGYDFFPALNKSLQDKLEKQANLQDWY